jgi:FtsH-binding integral membrane protein
MQFGVIGILVGQIVSSIISYLPISYYSGNLIEYSVKEQINDFLPALFLSIAVGLSVFFLVETSKQSALVELILFGFFGCVIYISVSYALKLEALKLTMQLLHQNFKKIHG